MSRLAASDDGAAVVQDRLLYIYDATGARLTEQKLDRRATAITRFGDEWLVLADRQTHLARVSAGGNPEPFAAGKGTVVAFGVGRDDTVAVARGEALELWSRDDERRWVTKGGPYTQAVVARDHVVALGEDGGLVFFSREKGEVLGALRLASPDPSHEWRLAVIDVGVVILALGEWLVWIDTSTRKTIRRVRARSKVLEISADADHVVVAVEDGFIQAFRAPTGEPRAALSVQEDGVSAIALGTDVLFTLGAAGADSIRASERTSLDIAESAAAPISAIASRGNLTVISDRSGRVRILEAKTSEPAGLNGGARARRLDAVELRDVGTLAVGEGTVGVFISKDETVIAASTRVVMRAPRPWSAPRPIALRGAPAAFAADDAYAFAGTQAGVVDVYDLETARHVTTYALSSDDRITALVRLSGALLVVGTGALDGRILVVDVAEAKVVHRISPHEEAFGVTCLASDPRGRIVASGSDDGSVALLDPVKGRVLARLRVNETPMSMAFESTGRRLACVFADGTAAIVTLAAKGATVADLGVRGATHVAWGDGIVFGFKDGRAESGDRYVRPSEAPSATRQ